jgi:double-stranded uracil-DNA glycosylase
VRKRPLGERPRPTRDELEAARGKKVPDVIVHDLDVLFVGINPGLYTAAVGHHFARPGNRFWPALYLSGFTPRLLSPFEEEELLFYGLGITNLVMRATASASELDVHEYRRGAISLRRKVARYKPRAVAFLGLEAYRKGLARPGASAGPQEEAIAAAPVWALPNTSGLNAHYRLEDFVGLFRKLRRAARD